MLKRFLIKCFFIKQALLTLSEQSQLLFAVEIFCIKNRRLFIILDTVILKAFG